LSSASFLAQRDALIKSVLARDRTGKVGDGIKTNIAIVLGSGEEPVRNPRERLLLPQRRSKNKRQRGSKG